MMTKNKNIFFGLLTVCFFVGCGQKKGNVNPQINADASKSYFVANKYLNYSNLYSFNFINNETKLIKSQPSASYDGIVFQKYDNSNNLQGIYFAERFSKQKPSRVTYYQTQVDDSGKENTQFPMNLYSIMFVGDKLIGVGYDKGEIVQTDVSLQNSYVKNIEINNLIKSSPHDASESSANTSSLLYADGKVFAVSQGSYRDQNVKPYIYQLTDDLKSVENKWPIDGCFNAAKHFKVIDESKLILSCNPYSNQLSQTINVFLVDTSTVKTSKSPSIIKVLEKQRVDAGIQQFDIGGISDDRNSIFVSERKKIDSSDWANKVLITSYWVDLSNTTNITLNDLTRQTPVNVVSGSVTYNYAAKSYLFSCSVASDFTCAKGMGAVSQSKDASNRVQVDFGIKGNDDLKFPIPVF